VVRARRLAIACIVLLLTHNVIVLVLHDEVATLLVNVMVAAGVVAMGVRWGLRREEIVGRPRWWSVAIASGLLAAVAVAGVAAVWVGQLPPAGATGGTDAPVPGIWFRLLIGIPVGTALCEELIFRGVILAAWDRVTTTTMSTMVTSVMFGLWHLAAEVRRVGGLSPAVSVGVVATTAASALVLCPLRRRAGDLIAPIVLHAAVNVVVLASIAFAAG